MLPTLGRHPVTFLCVLRNTKDFHLENNNIKLSRPMKSSIRDHSEIQNHKLTYDNFKIIDTSPCEYDLIILESLWIWKDKPNLNEYSSSTDLEILK